MWMWMGLFGAFDVQFLRDVTEMRFERLVEYLTQVLQAQRWLKKCSWFEDFSKKDG